MPRKPNRKNSPYVYFPTACIEAADLDAEREEHVYFRIDAANNQQTRPSMFTVSVDIIINRPVEDVFAFIADAENDPQWCPSVKEIRRTAGDKPGIGTRYRMRHAPGGMAFDAMVETIHYQPCERIEWRMTDRGHELRIVYVLEPVDGGAKTKLRQTSHVETRGWLRIPGFLMQSFIKKDMEKEMTKQFQNLARLLERQTTSLHDKR